MTHIIVSVLVGFLAVMIFQLGLGVLVAVIELVANIWLELEELYTK